MIIDFFAARIGLLSARAPKYVLLISIEKNGGIFWITAKRGSKLR